MIFLPSTNNIKFDLAIPDSFLYGTLSEIDRTFKVFQLARALSIFRVDNLFLYQILREVVDGLAVEIEPERSA